MFRRRVLDRVPLDLLMGSGLAILLATCPMNWEFKALWFGVFGCILIVLTLRLPAGRGWKIISAVLVAVALIVASIGPVSDQYHIDAVLRDYQTKRDLVAKYQAHDISLKLVVDQYDRMRAAQSIFERLSGKADEQQRAALDQAAVEDLKNTMNNFDAIALPMGQGLRIKLGPNMYKVINPVPMFGVPKLSFAGLPQGSTAKVVDESNLGFTVLFLPLSIPVDQFGVVADSEL